MHLLTPELAAAQAPGLMLLLPLDVQVLILAWCWQCDPAPCISGALVTTSVVLLNCGIAGGSSWWICHRFPASFVPYVAWAGILNVPKSLCSRPPVVKADTQDAASVDQPSQKQCGQAAG